MRRFTPATYQENTSVHYAKLKNFCVGTGGGHIKYKFLKHYQVFYKYYLKFGLSINLL